MSTNFFRYDKPPNQEKPQNKKLTMSKLRVELSECRNKNIQLKNENLRLKNQIEFFNEIKNKFFELEGFEDKKKFKKKKLLHQKNYEMLNSRPLRLSEILRILKKCTKKRVKVLKKFEKKFESGLLEKRDEKNK